MYIFEIAKKNESTQKGFSLVELLVVALLIGVLTSAIIVIINPATIRARGRDSQRISDLKTIQIALEQFYLKHRGYPSSATSGCQVSSGVASTCFIKITGSSDRLSQCLLGTGSCNSLTGFSAVTNSVPSDPTASTGTNSPCNGSPTQAYFYIAPYRSGSTQLADGYVVTATMELASAVGGNRCSTGSRNWSTWGLCGDQASCYAVENK